MAGVGHPFLLVDPGMLFQPHETYCLGFFKGEIIFHSVSIRWCQNNYLKSEYLEGSSLQISFSADWLLFAIKNKFSKEEPLDDFAQDRLIKPGLDCSVFLMGSGPTEFPTERADCRISSSFPFPSQEYLHVPEGSSPCSSMAQEFHWSSRSWMRS